MSLKPMKPITKPGEGKKRQKYVSNEVYLRKRYKISAGLGPEDKKVNPLRTTRLDERLKMVY